ncbi:MAG: PAS domain S-box protein [Bdellovibrionales bacterium]|nr:PAS domain S-box protein [Bdellovibrionales bacterium]
MDQTKYRHPGLGGVEAENSPPPEDPSFFKQLLNSIQDPVYVISPADGFRIRYVNEAACRHWGYSQEQLVQMCIPDWDPEFTLETCEASWARIQREKRISFETWHEISSGDLIPVEITSNYLVYEGEELIAGFIKNISERRETEEKISDLTTNLMRSNKELEEFAYVASHDLREPLATLGSFVHLLESRFAAAWPEEAKEWLAYIQKSADRMRNMIDSLLAYSRLNALELNLAEVDTRKLVEELLVDLESMIQTAGAEITVLELPTVVADKMQLGHVFQNLLTNAIKYSQLAGRPKVEISAHLEENEWVFSVKDNGPGVDPKASDRIFEPFQRGVEESEASGTGLGLSICRKTVERHGGRIWLSQRTDGLTEFCFSLPVRKLLS